MAKGALFQTGDSIFKDFIRRQSQKSEKTSLGDKVKRAKVTRAFINGQGIRRKVHEIREKFAKYGLGCDGDSRNLASSR